MSMDVFMSIIPIPMILCSYSLNGIIAGSKNQTSQDKRKHEFEFHL